MKTYSIIANRTAKDVIANNDIILNSNLTLEEAKIASLQIQREGGHIAVWIEEEEKPAPRITRTIERDIRSHAAYAVVRIDGWAI